MWFYSTFTKGFLIKLSQVSFNFLPPESNVFCNCVMVIHNFWAVDQKGYYTCCWSWMKTDSRRLSMEENWPAGNPYMSVGRIPLHDITTIISVASKTFKNVLLSTRRPHRRWIMNLFRKLKLSCTCSNSTSLPTPHPRNKARVKPPSVQASSAHASYA